MSEIQQRCNLLCFLSDVSKAHFLEVLRKSDIVPSPYPLQLVRGELRIENGTSVRSQGFLVGGFISTVTVRDTTVENVTTSGSFIKFSSSEALLENVFVRNIIDSDGLDPFLSVNFDSKVTVKNLSYKDSKTPFLRLLSASLAIDRLSVSNVTANTPIISLLGSQSLNITNSIIQNANVSSTYLLYATDILFEVLSNITISNTINRAIEMYYSNFTTIDIVTISNATQGMYLYRCIIASMNNCTFKNLGKIEVQKGGALQLYRGSLNIANSIFEGNKAVSGGAIYIE